MSPRLVTGVLTTALLTAVIAGPALQASASPEPGHTVAATASSPKTALAPAPAPPRVVSPISGSTTSSSRPVFTGTGQPGATITVEYSSTSPIGTAKVSTAGTWTVAPNKGLALGYSSLSAVQLIDGNRQNARFEIIRLETPALPDVTAPANGTTVSSSRPVFSGTAEPGSRISIGYGPSSIIGTGTTDLLGRWTITPDRGLGSGVSHLIVTLTLGDKSVAISHTITRTP